MLIIDRHNVADLGVFGLFIAVDIDRIAVHRRFTAGGIKTDQAGELRLVLAFTLNVERALYRR
ncbi:hypothetical protein D3C81_1307010 [compost metagenome]